MPWRDGVPRMRGRWLVEVIGEQDHEWHQISGDMGRPAPSTGAEVIARTLAEHGEESARWARAFCMPEGLNVAWYDLHYPEGRTSPLGPHRAGALGPHLWIPAPEAYYLAGVRRHSWDQDDGSKQRDS